MSASSVRMQWMALSLASLVACGGGGSGGGASTATPAPTPPVAGPTTPLALTSDNAVPAATLAFALFEAPLRLVQLVGESLPGSLAAGAPLTYSRLCRTRGGLDVDFTDVDASRTPTPGDAARRRVDYDAASISSEFAGTLRSEALQGQLVVRTAAPLLGFLNTYAHAGRIDLEGASAGRLSIGTNLELNSDSANVSADTNGDGNAELRDRLVRWTQFNDGLIWAEPRYDAARFRILNYSARTPPSLLGRASPSVIPVTGLLDLQFNRRLSSLEGVDFTFRSSSGDIAAVPDVHGARLILRPAVQLTHGVSYSLGVTGLLRDEQGNPLQTPAASFATRDNLAARISGPPIAFAAQGFTLSSTGSRSTDGPIAGPGESAEFELEVRNRDGEYARARRRLDVFGDDPGAYTLVVVKLQRLAPSTQAPSLHAFSSASGVFDSSAVNTAFYSTGTVGAYATIFRYGSAVPVYPGFDAIFRFRGQNTLLGLVPGSYATAGTMNPPEGTTAALTIEFAALQAAGCPYPAPFFGSSSFPPHSFTILDSQQDANGAPQRLAVDFRYRCVNDPELEATGSLRHRSAVPLPADLLVAP